MRRRQMTRTKLSVNYDRPDIIYKIYSCKNYDIISRWLSRFGLCAHMWWIMAGARVAIYSVIQ